MDPNAALEIIRYQLMRWNEEAPDFDPDELAEQVDEAIRRAKEKH